MSKIRILVVDDAVVVRRMVSDVLGGDRELEVVGTAPNGRIALAKIPQLNPDLVTLDVEMPDLDGLQTLKELRKVYPRLPVIMFSTMTQRGGEATLDALALGANDYVTKPSNVGSVAAAMQAIREQLIPRIKEFCGRGPSLEKAALPPAPRKASSGTINRHFPFGQRRLAVVAIGVSTGGPNALAALLPTLPADFPVPIVIVQHMPALFTELLAKRLNTLTALQVREGKDGEILTPGKVWVAPGDYHLSLVKEGLNVRLRLHQEPPENSCRPAVDVLFRSVAKTYGPGALGVVLTGMGQDGLRGCEAIREAGGQVLVQDEASSVVWGMPGFVARAGLADHMLPLSEVGPAILRLGQKGSTILVRRPAPAFAATGARKANPRLGEPAG